MHAGLWDRLAAALGLTLSEVEADRELAAGLLASMLAEAPTVRELMACGVERFRSVALLELMLDRSFEPGGGGEDLAYLALAIVGVLDTRGHKLAEITQVRARIWAAMGNARRSTGDLARAEKDLDRASLLLACAPAPLEEAFFYRLRSLLFRDQGDVRAAIAAKELAVALLTGYAPPPLVAIAMIELAALQLQPQESDCVLDSLRAATAVLGSDLAAEVGAHV